MYRAYNLISLFFSTFFFLTKQGRGKFLIFLCFPPRFQTYPQVLVGCKISIG